MTPSVSQTSYALCSDCNTNNPQYILNIPFCICHIGYCRPSDHFLDECAEAVVGSALVGFIVCRFVDGIMSFWEKREY